MNIKEISEKLGLSFLNEAEPSKAVSYTHLPQRQNSNRLRRRPCHPRRQLRRNPNLLQRNPDAIVITITLIIPVP